MRSDSTSEPDRLNYHKMAGIVRLNLNFLRGMDALPMVRSHTRETLCETADFEIDGMKQAFGPALPALLQMAGICGLATRNDIDRLVGALKSGWRL